MFGECLLIYSVALFCLITLVKCAPAVSCPSLDGTPQYYSKVDRKCHACLSCEEGYGLSEVCGDGYGQNAQCLPCPTDFYSPNYDWNTCGQCRICDNTMDDIIPCTARTDRQCGLCKFGYFRHDERNDHCVRCDDELYSYLYPDCLRTTPRLMIDEPTEEETVTPSPGSTDKPQMSPGIVVLIAVVVLIIFILIILFVVCTFCLLGNNHVSFTQPTPKDGTKQENESFIRKVPEPGSERGSITHNDSRQGAIPIEDAQNGSIAVDVEINIQGPHKVDEGVASPPAESDSDGGQSSDQNESQRSLNNTSTKCKETQTNLNEDVPISLDQDTNDNIRHVQERLKQALTITKGLDPAIEGGNITHDSQQGATPDDHSNCLPKDGGSDSDKAQPKNFAFDPDKVDKGFASPQPVSNTTENDSDAGQSSDQKRSLNNKETQTINLNGDVAISSDQDTNESRRQFQERLEQALIITKDVYLGDMNDEDRVLMNRILHERPEVVDDASRGGGFNYIRMAEVFNIHQDDRKHFVNAWQVISHIADTDQSILTVALFLKKLEGSNQCYDVVRRLVDQIIARNS